MAVVNENYLKEIEGARQDFRSLIRDNMNIAPLLLRIAFHDAGNYNVATRRGGANGSIRLAQELDRPVNKGMEIAVRFCEQVKQKHPSVSYADLYQLAGVVAVEVCGGPAIDFAAGRKDTNSADEDGIPRPREPEKLRCKFYRMGLHDKDIVALSGAHTLGGAHKDRTPGFDGIFTPSPLKFDNSYYVELLRGDTQGLVKFPTDKVLVQDPIFRPLVELYARDQRAFFKHYAESHKKLSELGFNCEPYIYEDDSCGEQLGYGRPYAVEDGRRPQQLGFDRPYMVGDGCCPGY